MQTQILIQINCRMQDGPPGLLAYPIARLQSRRYLAAAQAGGGVGQLHARGLVAVADAAVRDHRWRDAAVALSSLLREFRAFPTVVFDGVMSLLAGLSDESPSALLGPLAEDPDGAEASRRRAFRNTALRAARLFIRAEVLPRAQSGDTHGASVTGRTSAAALAAAGAMTRRAAAFTVWLTGYAASVGLGDEALGLAREAAAAPRFAAEATVFANAAVTAYGAFLEGRRRATGSGGGAAAAAGGVQEEEEVAVTPPAAKRRKLDIETGSSNLGVALPPAVAGLGLEHSDAWPPLTSAERALLDEARAAAQRAMCLGDKSASTLRVFVGCLVHASSGSKKGMRRACDAVSTYLRWGLRTAASEPTGVEEGVDGSAGSTDNPSMADVLHAVGLATLGRVGGLPPLPPQPRSKAEAVLALAADPAASGIAIPTPDPSSAFAIYVATLARGGLPHIACHPDFVGYTPPASSGAKAQAQRAELPLPLQSLRAAFCDGLAWRDWRRASQVAAAASGWGMEGPACASPVPRSAVVLPPLRLAPDALAALQLWWHLLQARGAKKSGSASTNSPSNAASAALTAVSLTKGLVRLNILLCAALGLPSATALGFADVAVAFEAAEATAGVTCSDGRVYKPASALAEDAPLHVQSLFAAVLLALLTPEVEAHKRAATVALVDCIHAILADVDAVAAAGRSGGASEVGSGLDVDASLACLYAVGLLGLGGSGAAHKPAAKSRR